jgi:hypothetical protein
MRAVLIALVLIGSQRQLQAAPPGGVLPDGLWQEMAVTELPLKSRQKISPRKYRTVRLNLAVLQNTLSRAPMEFTSAAKIAGVEMSLPLPDGRFARFRVVESPIMEPKLAAKFPQIRNYSGVGIDDPKQILRFNTTPQGFHAFGAGQAGPINAP